MEDTSPRIDYHSVTMTVNGVTKSVLVPLPKPHSNSYSRPFTAKLPNRTSIIFTKNSSSCNEHPVTVSDMTNTVPVVTARSSQVPRAYNLPRQHLAPSVSPVMLKRLVMPVKPVVRRPGEDHGRVVILQPRLVVACSAAVTPESSQSVDSRPKVHVLPPTSSAGTARCVQLPVSLIKPTATTSSSSSNGATRPIILRKSQPVSRPVVRPFAQSTSSSVVEIVDSLAPLSSEMTVVSLPRTLSRPEAIAAGWYTGSRADNVQVVQSPDIIQQTTSDNCAPAAVDANVVVRHIVPMDTDGEQLSDIGDDELKQSPSDSPLCDDAEHSFTVKSEQSDDDRIFMVDGETQMKVTEIFPGCDDVSSHDQDEKPEPATAVKIKDEYVTVNTAVMDDSSVSTETAPSDVEMSTASSRDNYLVLAEWSQDDDLPAMADKPVIDSTQSTEQRSTPKRRKRQRRNNNWFRYRPKRSASSVYKARRTGGPPKSAVERYGIVECFVSLAVLRLKKPSVDIRHVWRYICCGIHNQIQPCMCAGAVSPRSTSDVTAADGSKVGKLVETTKLIQPSLMASGSATLPVQQSGPTSADGVTPLLVRHPDGKLANVVAKRTSPGGTVTDTKKKYLLIKTKSGSYLVPVSGVVGESAVTGAVATLTNQQPPSPSPTSSMKAEPAVVTDSSGHRERIQQLKERLRQQEEQLQNIRSQLSCSVVNKFDLDDSPRY